VYLFSVLSFLTAITIAFFVPTITTSFFPVVTPVYRLAPLPFHPDDFAGSRVDDGPDGGYQVPATVDFDFGRGVAILFVGVGDPFDLTLEGGEDGRGHLR